MTAVPIAPRRYVSTATPEARREITRAVRDWLPAEEDRNSALRRHYAAGVEVRDLVALAASAGWEVTTVHMHRIVRGARPTDS